MYINLLRILIVDESVINSVTYNCFLNCDPSSPGNNEVVTFYDDSITDNENRCCDYGLNYGYGTDDTTCIKCKKFSCIH